MPSGQQVTLVGGVLPSWVVLAVEMLSHFNRAPPPVCPAVTCSPVAGPLPCECATLVSLAPKPVQGHFEEPEQLAILLAGLFTLLLQLVILVCHGGCRRSVRSPASRPARASDPRGWVQFARHVDHSIGLTDTVPALLDGGAQPDAIPILGADTRR